MRRPALVGLSAQPFCEYVDGECGEPSRDYLGSIHALPNQARHRCLPCDLHTFRRSVSCEINTCRYAEVSQLAANICLKGSVADARTHRDRERLPQHAATEGLIPACPPHTNSTTLDHSASPMRLNSTPSPK